MSARQYLLHLISVVYVNADISLHHFNTSGLFLSVKLTWTLWREEGILVFLSTSITPNTTNACPFTLFPCRYLEKQTSSVTSGLKCSYTALWCKHSKCERIWNEHISILGENNKTYWSRSSDKTIALPGLNANCQTSIFHTEEWLTGW